MPTAIVLDAPAFQASTKSNGTTRSLETVLGEAERCYVEKHPKSKALYQQALKSLPGGNTRSVLHTDPFTIYQKRGEGNKLWDHDSNMYTDLNGEFTSGLYGHSNQMIRKALISTFDNVGLSLGATTSHEIQLASLLTQRFPQIEQLRFCNSGTEANLYALSVARHVTKRRKIIVFDGGYHGGVLLFGNGVGKNNVDMDDWVLGTYNDIQGARSIIESTTGVAAVIVEAMQGAGGCIPASQEFLQTVQEAAKAAGIIFILDEVLTSRLSPSGLAGKHGLKPDLTTLGKYIGGGMAFGAFGGRADLMAACDPRLAGSISHSGTFNNNTLAMVCGYTGLAECYTPEANLSLNAQGDRFRSQLQSAAEGTKMVVTGVGAVLTIHFLSDGKAPMKAGDMSLSKVPELKRLFWLWCLARGYWITERGMVSLILGTTEAELDAFIGVCTDFIKEFSDFLEL